jgi:hypothetical protein
MSGEVVYVSTSNIKRLRDSLACDLRDGVAVEVTLKDGTVLELTAGAARWIGRLA